MTCLIALDIDGTCLNEKGYTSNKLRTVLSSLPDTTRLVYSTGRNLDSAIEVIEKSGLPHPDYFVSDVGNRIHKKSSDNFETDALFEVFNSLMWSIASVSIEGIMAYNRFNLIPQQGSLNRRLAFWATNPRDAQANSSLLSQCIGRTGKVRWDGPTIDGKYWIDVLPVCSGKSTAISYICFIEAIPLHRVIAVGDSMNDFDILSGASLAAVPSNATKRLVSALQATGKNVLVTKESGPDGTAKALSILLDSVENDMNQMSSNNLAANKASIDSLRGMKVPEDFLESVQLWPARLSNWGLHPGTVSPLYKIHNDIAVEILAERRNWWWAAAGHEQRHRILERYQAIPVKFLLDKLSSYIRRNYYKARLLGGMVSGSYLYRLDGQAVNDLDMVLLLDGLDNPKLGFEIEVPGLRAAFPERFSKDLRLDRVGLGLLDISSLNPNCESPEVLQMVASMEGSGLPLFGQQLTCTPMPVFDLLCQATKLLNDGERMLRELAVSYGRKIRLRGEEAFRVVQFAMKQISYPAEIRKVAGFMSGPLAHQSLADYLFNCRRYVAAAYLALIVKLIHDANKNVERQK